MEYFWLEPISFILGFLTASMVILLFWWNARYHEHRRLREIRKLLERGEKEIEETEKVLRIFKRR